VGSYVDLQPYLHPNPIQIVESTPLHRIYNIFKQLGLRYCLVTRFGKLVGIITKKDLLNYFAALHQIEVTEDTDITPLLGTALYQ